MEVFGFVLFFLFLRYVRFGVRDILGNGGGDWYEWSGMECEREMA